MDIIDNEQVLRMAKMSRIELAEDEISVYAAQLGSILSYVNLLDTANLEGLAPTCFISPPHGQLRDDVEVPSLPAERLLSNGPSVKKGHFAVPKVIGQPAGGV